MMSSIVIHARPVAAPIAHVAASRCNARATSTNGPAAQSTKRIGSQTVVRDQDGWKSATTIATGTISPATMSAQSAASRSAMPRSAAAVVDWTASVMGARGDNYRRSRRHLVTP